ncbi:cytochrome c family protein [Sphingomonas deserti]|uniref:Cytochrome c family protein n=2 Tax=Allosphingosinicella deserti TaxID=2116704 RepID=A0A2P7QST1_9SPHN|nr:cytochrome c family protein [Sphingomonas deserti]
MTPDYPETRGYPIEGVAPVDLAAAQREWPTGAEQPGERATMIGYIRNIDKAVPPALPASAAAAAIAAPADLGTLLASADAARGQRAAQACAACHSLEAGGPNRVGPTLWAIVGRPVARQPGFAYSPALTATGGQWTYEALDHFLAGPARAVPGTKMSFAGLRNPRDRANLLAYLATIGAKPLPFPAPAPAPAVAKPVPTAAISAPITGQRAAP